MNSIVEKFGRSWSISRKAKYLIAVTAAYLLLSVVSVFVYKVPGALGACQLLFIVALAFPFLCRPFGRWLGMSIAIATPLQRAMRILVKTIRDDHGYAWGWQSNLAMSMVDQGVDHETANRAAARFLRLLTMESESPGVDITKFPEFQAFTKNWAEQSSQVDPATAEDGWYRLVHPGESRDCVVRVYSNPDNQERGIGFNVADGGVFMPIWDLSEESKLYPIKGLNG